MNDVAIDLDQLVAHLKTPVLVGDTVRIETANEDSHHRPVLVTSQTQTKTGRW